MLLRKLSLVAVAAVSLGAAALAPTSASAWGAHGWHGGWHGGYGWGAPRFYVGGPAITATVMAAVMCGGWSRPPGDRAGA